MSYEISNFVDILFSHAGFISPVNALHYTGPPLDQEIKKNLTNLKKACYATTISFMFFLQ